MTAHDRLRQLHANATPGPWQQQDDDGILISRQPGSYTYLTSSDGDFAPEDAVLVATLRNVLPQIANLAEAAAEAVAKYAPADKDWTAWNNQDGHDWEALRDVAQALADLEKTLGKYT